MEFIDQLNRKVVIKNFPPQRIISLVPSITELLVELGLESQIVGITKFCIHPKNVFQQKEKIGGTKNLSIEKIKHLQPDLIIGNKEENIKTQIDELSQHFPVWMSDVNTYQDALWMINDIGKITNTVEKALKIINEINEKFQLLMNVEHILKNKSVLYFIWYQPYMVVGKNTYINDILTKIGATNVAEKQRYFTIDVREIERYKPDYILLSSEPFPFKEKHQIELQSQISKNIKVLLVNGEVFSWYGPRMRYLYDYIKDLKTP